MAGCEDRDRETKGKKKEVIMERRGRERRRDPIIENSSLNTMISLWIVFKRELRVRGRVISTILYVYIYAN